MPLQRRPFYHVGRIWPRRVLTQRLCGPERPDGGPPTPRTLAVGRFRLALLALGLGRGSPRDREADRPLSRPDQGRLPQTLAPAAVQVAPQAGQFLLRTRAGRPLGSRLAGRYQPLQRPAFQQVVVHRGDAQDAGRVPDGLLAGQDFQDGRRAPLGQRRAVPAQRRGRQRLLAPQGTGRGCRTRLRPSGLRFRTALVRGRRDARSDLAHEAPPGGTGPSGGKPLSDATWATPVASARRARSRPD